MVVHIVCKGSQHFVLLRYLQAGVSLTREGKYRLCIVTPSLWIVIRRKRRFSQGLTVDLRDSPRRQIAEPRIEFAGNGSTQRVKLRFGASSFGSIAPPGNGDERGLAGAVEERQTGRRCQEPSTEHCESSAWMGGQFDGWQRR
jgi:hypothetical protein